MNTIIIATIILAVAGLVLGGIIAIASKFFEVASDPKVEKIRDLLPGANCGGCGFAGCEDMAVALAEGRALPGKCPVCSAEQNDAIADILGIKAETAEKMVAVVFCGGSHSRIHRAASYNGVMDCRSAVTVGNGGSRGCRFGCLGFGSCAHECPFGAIEMRDGLAVVHPEICRGCGKCVDACPRKLIRLVPAKAKVHVYCNSLDKPLQKLKYCKVPCLACRKCVKADPDHMQGSGPLVRVDYNDPPSKDIVDRAKCPTGCLQTELCHRKIVSAPVEKTAAKTENKAVKS